MVTKRATSKKAKRTTPARRTTKKAPAPEVTPSATESLGVLDGPMKPIFRAAFTKRLRG